jgi:hypothetical protein
MALTLIAGIGSLVLVAAPSAAESPQPDGADPSIARVIVEEAGRDGGSQELRAAIRRIRREHFGSMRVPERRAEGIAKLRAFDGLSAIEPLYRELRAESDDVVNAMFDHIATMGEAGQAALAWIAIHDESDSLRARATVRLARPASAGALGVLDATLRSSNHMIANRAGSLAGAIGAIEAIPLLIHAQAAGDEPSRQNQGDLAWISFLRQRSYVANLVPIVGTNSGGFQPVIGVINEGALLQVTDAVVVSYRPEVHDSLVRLSSAAWGRSTEGFGYDTDRWLAWYRDEFIPFRIAQAEEAERIARAKRGERRDDYDQDF